MLPLVLSGSIGQKSFARPLRIVLALAVSVVVFTLLLKVSTVLLGVPSYFWRWFTGAVLIIFGLLVLFPQIWATTAQFFGFKDLSQKFLRRGLKKKSPWGDFLIGASLGPIFTSCGPTYAIIVSVSLPASWLIGMLYLLVFVFGLTLCLLIIAFLGQKLVHKLTILNKAGGWFQRFLAIIFIVIGLSILTGYDRRLEILLIERGFYDWVIELEEGFLPDS